MLYFFLHNFSNYKKLLPLEKLRNQITKKKITRIQIVTQQNHKHDRNTGFEG